MSISLYMTFSINIELRKSPYKEFCDGYLA